MASKARLTSDVWEEQDPIGRTYSGPNAPTNVKEREGDMWIQETTKAVPEENLQKFVDVPETKKMISNTTRNRVSVTRWKRKG
jgi:hypothetical protein